MMEVRVANAFSIKLEIDNITVNLFSTFYS